MQISLLIILSALSVFTYAGFSLFMQSVSKKVHRQFVAYFIGFIFCLMLSANTAFLIGLNNIQYPHPAFHFLGLVFFCQKCFYYTLFCSAKKNRQIITP